MQRNNQTRSVALNDLKHERPNLTTWLITYSLCALPPQNQRLEVKKLPYSPLITEAGHLGETHAVMPSKMRAIRGQQETKEMRNNNTGITFLEKPISASGSWGSDRRTNWKLYQREPENCVTVCKSQQSRGNCIKNSKKRLGIKTGVNNMLNPAHSSETTFAGISVSLDFMVFSFRDFKLRGRYSVYS